MGCQQTGRYASEILRELPLAECNADHFYDNLHGTLIRLKFMPNDI